MEIENTMTNNVIQYAPIIITVYTRKQNLENLISSLLECPEACNSDLYIFSDAASKKEDELMVSEVRDYISTIKGFKSVTAIKPDINSRISKIYHVRNKIIELFEHFDKYIFLEDDNIVSKHFLRYMNDAMDFYKDDSRITAVSAYTVPIKFPFWYKKDIWLGKRYCPWGYGMRKEWYYQFNRTSYDRYSIATKKENIKKFYAVGRDILNILYDDSTGKISAGDVKIVFDQVMKNQYTLFPTKSLVRNVGFDGMGEHCCETNRFDTKLNCDVDYGIVFEKNIKECKSISKRFQKFQDNTTILGTIKYKTKTYLKFILKKLGLFDFVKQKIKHQL